MSEAKSEVGDVLDQKAAQKLSVSRTLWKEERGRAHASFLVFRTAMSSLQQFRRVHHTGTETLISQHADSWQIRIDLKEAGHSDMTIVGFLSPTLEQAKELADQEVRKHGHTCNKSCKGWVAF